VFSLKLVKQLLGVLDDSTVKNTPGSLVPCGEYTRESQFPCGEYTRESRFPCGEYIEESRLPFDKSTGEFLVYLEQASEQFCKRTFW
jgi:hypothetical protein